MQPVTKLLFGGPLLGILWSIVYYFILALSGIDVPFIHAVLYGALIGTILGVVNLTVLTFIGSKGKFAQKSTALSTLIMVVLIAVTFVFLSPTVVLFFVNVFSVSIASAVLTEFALNESNK
jgi:hypothetical protein